MHIKAITITAVCFFVTVLDTSSWMSFQGQLLGFISKPYKIRMVNKIHK